MREGKADGVGGRPGSYPRRVLLAAAGLSPQVVTETVFALAAAGPGRFVPTEVHIITTRSGAERARLTLLGDDPGWFGRLLHDHDLPAIHFDEKCIHTVAALDGAALVDIQSPADNERAADGITELVRALTTDNNMALHVSIAGGRKTLGFYLGYALSLFGRPQDRLSHVLVSPPYESHPDFFYPTPRPRVIYSLDSSKQPLDTSAATVMLAEIPFVRLRHGLSEELLGGRASFSETVAQAQRALDDAELLVDLAGRRVVCGGRTVALQPILVAWMAWMARRRIAGGEHGGFVHWSEASAQEFIAEYARVADPMSHDLEEARRVLRDGFTKDYFLEKRSRLNKALRNGLGAACTPYLIESRGRRPRTRHGIALPASRIRIDSQAGSA